MKRHARQDRPGTCRKCQARSPQVRVCWVCLGTGNEIVAANYRPARLLSLLPREALVAVFRAWPRIALGYPSLVADGIAVRGSWEKEDKPALKAAGFVRHTGASELVFKMGIHKIPSRAELTGRKRKPRRKKDTSMPLLDRVAS